MDLLSNYTRPLKKNFYQRALSISHEIEREGILSNSFYEASIILIPKSDRTQQKKKIIGQYL
jgi:hypothetical protein